VATIAELEEIRALAAELRTARLDAAETMVELEASDVPDPVGPIVPEAEEYVRSSMAYEEQNSRIRQVAPWAVSIAGGVASTAGSTGAGASVDWFGTVEVGYNFGGLVQAAAEHSLLAARQRELLGAPDELLYAARAVDASLRKSVAVLDSQIATLTEAERSLREQLDGLERAEVANRVQTVSVLKLRVLMVEARLVYTRSLLERRRPWENPHEP
jgi:hypothetical protein